MSESTTTSGPRSAPHAAAGPSPADTRPSAGPELPPWQELLGAALLGAARRRPPGGSTTALLDAAAAQTVRQRAGAQPASARPAPAPAPEDPRPEMPEAAARRLAWLLAGRHRPGGGAERRTASPDLAELLPQWLAAADEAGYAAPAEQVPTLLEAARGRTDLRRHALSLAGPRGRWLAGLNPEWRFVLRSAPPSTVRRAGSTTAAGAAPTGAEQLLWNEGLFAERVAVLTEVRARNPRAGLELLAAEWGSERAEDRLIFLDTLRHGLSTADEGFIEQALADRSKNVRATAAELLAMLPESAYAARMAERARAHVGLDRCGGTARITVEAPHEVDAAMRRDGVATAPPQGQGQRAWWLSQLVDSAPLGGWRDRLGGRSPAEIVALPVADGWERELHAAWCRAAVRQQAPEWARALIGPPTAPLAHGPGDPAKLLTVLPDEERADWAARFIAVHGLSEAFRILGVCALPWSPKIGTAVIDALEIARDQGSYPWSFSGVLGLAERCLRPSAAERLTPLTAVPDESGDGAPGAGAYWAEAFQRLVTTLRVRAEMYAELEVEQ
ncbi:DUF5691 domain-containing protein [Streptomyces sulphureus]|uniref:DUF5691 domain-containing protein n=1 Tax=Streptomyces sulphureus TaxID=47758 RepID=UPI0003776E4C|nr:DUF5691 domain-containing protein [Streptomyces sulphureus]